MILTRTPFRISFFGGGTDYPVYYRVHGGEVLSTTINKYCYLMCRPLPPFFDHRFRVRYTEREETQTVEEIRHPAVRACLQFMDVRDGIEIVHTADIPARSGVGSSSAFTVGLLHALYALRGEMVTQRKLAYDAIHVEQERIGEHVGSQDQTAAAFGGFNHIRFAADSEITVRPVTLTESKMQRLQECLRLYFTGFSRDATHIAHAQVLQTPERLHELQAMRQMVPEAISILNGPEGGFDAFGRLLHESWQLKRGLTSLISNSEIDAMYAEARRHGAVGGKLCGAGGGGFLLLYVPPPQHGAVDEALRHLVRVPFRMDKLGSHVAFYSR